MKKQLIAAVAAIAMTVNAMPAMAFAADNMPEPVLRYTFDGKNPLADEKGKNALKLSGGASVTTAIQVKDFYLTVWTAARFYRLIFCRTA